jgi:hypothetical protein
VLSAKFSLCLIHCDSQHLCVLRRAELCHLLLAVLVTEVIPWSFSTAPRRPPLPPVSFPLSLALFFSPKNATGTRARPPPSLTTPRLPWLSDKPRSSTSPPAMSPSKESSHDARDSRRHRRFFRRYPTKPPSIAPPPALLRPCRPPRRPQGEHPVQKDSSPSPIPCPSAALSYSPVATGARDGRAGSLTQSDQPRWLADVALDPQSETVGQMTPGVKSPTSYF